MIFKGLFNQNNDYTYEDIKDITDVSILVDIACRTDDEDLAESILYRIEQRYREHIVLNAECKSIRELAFFSIDSYDDGVWVEIAENTIDGRICAMAICNLHSYEGTCGSFEWDNVIKVSSDDDLCFYAKEIVIPVTSNEELLNNVALNGYERFSIREEAVKNKCLTDRKVLYELAFNKNFSLRSAAVRKITDADDLKSIISVEEDYRIINYAKERLRYLEYLNGNN